MSAKSAKFSKTNKTLRKRVTRLVLKLIWFSVVSVITAVMGTGLFLLYISSGDENSINGIDFFNAIVLAGLFLMVILITFYYFSRKTKNTPIRWTRKSVFILTPLVVVVGIISIAMITPLTNEVETLRNQNTDKDVAMPATCEINGTLRSVVANTLPILSKTGSGTGFMIGEDGLILTAHHVVGDDSEPEINLASGKIKTKLIKSSEEFDLALLKIVGDRSTLGLAYKLPLVESYQLGDDVYSVGYPGNTFTAGSASLSKGIISRILTNNQLSLTNKDLPFDLELVQFDAPVNPGNSGGPLLNKCGVVGVVIAISTSNIYDGLPRDEGISFAVSSKTVKKIFAL